MSRGPRGRSFTTSRREPVQAAAPVCLQLVVIPLLAVDPDDCEALRTLLLLIIMSLHLLYGFVLIVV